MARRLRDVCALPESEPLWRAGRGFVVRDHARTCPHCGAPVIATIKRRQRAALIQIKP